MITQVLDEHTRTNICNRYSEICKHSAKFPLGLSILTLDDEAKQSPHHPPIKLVRLQVHKDMMQIINITDLSAFDLGSVQFDNRHKYASFLRCSVF
jgi:hypothetical protein